MKQLTFYVCGRCGKRFPTEKAARSCEMHHQWPIKCVDAKYYESPLGNKYPARLTLLFTDGGEVTYLKYSSDFDDPEEGDEDCPPTH